MRSADQTTAYEFHGALSREGAVGSLKLVMILLAALIFWSAATAVNGYFHSHSLVTVTPFLRGGAKLIVGMESSAPFHARVHEFWMGAHRPIALLAMLAAVVLLSARFLATGRVLDYLYLESECRDQRIYSGFVANILLSLAHAGLIYGLVVVDPGEHASLAPVMMLALFLLNLIWIGFIFFTSWPVERHALRGLRYLALTCGAATVVLFSLTWVLENCPPASAAVRGSQMILLSAGAAMALCIADAVVQAGVYFPKKRKAEGK